MASLQMKGGSWYAIFSHGKKKEWVGLEVPDTVPKTEARKALDNLMVKRALGLDKPVSQEIGFDQFADIFWERRIGQITRMTKMSDSFRLKRLKAFFHTKPISKITAEDLEEFIAECRETSLKSKTINNYLMVIGNIFQKAVEWGYLQKKAWEKLPLQKVRDAKERYCMTLEDIEKFHQAMTKTRSKEFPLFCMFLMYTGMRHTEIVMLRWSDINFDKLIVLVQNKPDIGFSTKNNKPRAIPMLDKLNSYLQVQFERVLPQPSDPLFPVASKSPRPECTFQGAWKTCLEIAGLKGRGICPHILRHSMASHLVMQGVPLKVIQELLGHRDIGTTANVYSHLLYEAKREAMEKLPY